MKKISTLLMMLFAFIGAWAQVYTPGARTTTLEAGKKYFISAATFYSNARPNLLYNNNGNLAYSNNKPTGYYKSAYVFTVEKIDGETYFIKNSDGKYLQSDNLASTETETGVKVVPYGKEGVKDVITCGYDVQACDEQGNKIEYNNIDGNTPIVCVYSDANKGWRHISGLEIGKSTPFAFYEAKEGVQLELTTDVNNPVYYTIKNMRGNAYAAYDGDTQTMKLLPTVEGPDHLFYFTKGSAEGTYKIHTYGTDKKCAAYNSWTEDGIDWYIVGSGNNDYVGFAISKEATLTATGSEAWNDYQNAHTSINWYGGDDAGSVWSIEKHQGVMPGLQLSTEDNIVLHYIRSNRRTSYVNFDGHNVTFKEGNEGLNSYWYFVEDKTATDVPEGYVAVKIFNAAHPTAVENYTSGYMEDSSYPAKTFLVGLRQIKDAQGTGYGYVIYLPGDANGWHDYNGTYVGAYGLGDRGSLWRIYPANKTVDQLKNEANTAKTNALAFIANAEEADFYTYTDEAIATAKAAVEAVDVTTLSAAVSSLLNATVNNAVTTLTATDKGTTGPVAGQYILLKNKEKKQYMTTMAEGNEVHRTSNASEFKALWQVVEGENGVKLYNPEKKLYLGSFSQSAKVQMVSEADAQEFEFTNQADFYGVFQNVGGARYTFAHMDGWYDRVVGWEAVSDASQWIISEVTLEESLADLQEIYDVVDNAFGTEPGQYKEMEASEEDELYSAFVGAKEILDSEDAKDIYAVILMTDDLKTKWNTQLANPDSREINLPVQGKFYRLKNVASGRYMNVKSASSVVVTDEGNNLPATIFYLGENNTMLSYSVGQYLDCGNKNLAAVGTSLSGEFAAARSGAKLNTIMYKNNSYWTYGNRANDVSIDRGSGTIAANTVGYDWELEEVTWLPVPMNTTAGYATLYAPVALNNGGRVEAYVGKAEGEWFKMTRVDAEDGVIPANTPVVLKYVEGAQVENNCVYLQISDSDKDAVVGDENELEGTFADTYFTTGAYALGLVDGEVGFYTAKMTNNQWLNNGFKAYLPKTGVAPTLRFNFGGNTTAIESVVAPSFDANAPIYDLSGRRVVNAVKGGLYIQNGKKFIVR